MSPPALPTLTTPTFAIAAALLSMPAGAQQGLDPPPLRSVPALAAPPSGDAAKGLPTILRADEIRGRPDLETTATGNAELRRGDMLIRADELRYEHPEDLARARGGVEIRREGNVYTGRELRLRVQRFEGVFLDPTYFFASTGAGGRAERIEFIDDKRSRAIGATYTSCPADDPGGPDWLLETSRVKLDFEANEGVAEGAVLRFLGVPILGAPVLSFPLTDARKSGWLPPTVNLDSRSGFEYSQPYYWNIAPQRDATFAPAFLTRRGFALDSEFRYLEPAFRGKAQLDLLPNDRVADRTRYALYAQHDHDLQADTGLRLRTTRASDDAYWKDFPRVLETLTPRLLATDALLQQREQARRIGDLSWYARVQRWQVLRDADPAARIDAPYERSPQVGARLLSRLGHGFELSAETEINRFTLPAGEPLPARPTGARVHAIGAVSWPWQASWGFLTPKAAVNSATYRLDQPLAGGGDSVSRTIPSVSLDSGLLFERDSRWFGRALRQTLEPRLLFVATPFRDQSRVPNFDAAAKDFNFDSIYTDNAFSGIDRVSDARQLTAGVTTRLIQPDTGVEALRLGIAQRYLFRDQRITPEGAPFTRRFSDVLLLASSRLIERWSLDASLQYSPDIDRTVRSALGARYSPGPFRTLSAGYRLTRGLNEQAELAWQWPIAGEARDPDASRTSPFARALDGAAGDRCSGTWYSVGRINYSMRDSRITDSIIGFEYDAGCWIGRIVAERLSTGRSEATTRLLLQLELVGLSRLGSNPLTVLRDNIPGYRLLREDRAAPRASPSND